MAEIWGITPDYLEEGRHKPHLDVPFQSYSGCWFPLIRFSSWLQAKLIQSNCCPALLECIAFAELASYNSNRIEFCEARQRAVGPVYCALGRLTLSSYRDVAEVLSNPQKRGAHLGRANLNASKCPAHFLLFESNLPNSNTHKVPRANLVENIFTAGTDERAKDENTRQLVNGFVSQLGYVERKQRTKVNGSCHISFPKELLDRFVLRWMHYVILGVVIDSDEDELLGQMQRVMSGSGYVTERIEGFFGKLIAKVTGKTSESDEAAIVQMYLKRSPVIQQYTPCKGAEKTDKQAFAEQVLGMVSLAAVLGGTATLAAALSDELAPFIEREDFAKDDEKLELFVLEAARRFCPVNLINVKAKRDITLTVGDSELEFPEDTLMSASIAMASFDESKFRDPYDFFPQREGLRERSLNFNTIGLDPLEGARNPYGLFAGERACPGRYLAVKMVIQVVSAFRFGYLEREEESDKKNS